MVPFEGDVVVDNGKPADRSLLDAEQEGSMAEQIQSKPTLIINRRRLLASGTALAASGVVPKADPVEAGHTTEAMTGTSFPMTETPGWNVCAVTARRLQEIAARNKIRGEAGLPLPSIPRELRRMKDAADTTEFETFADAHRSAIWEEALAPMREAKGDPNWRPRSWMDGMGLQAKVSRILRERFDAR